MNKNKKIKSNEIGLTLRGLAEVVVDQRNKGSHTKLRMHNTIADAAKRAWLTAGFANLSAGFGSMFGRPIVRSSMILTGAYGNDSSGNYYTESVAASGYKNALSCALLGLPDAKYEDINGAVSFLPLLDATGKVDSNKVRALANVEATSALSDVGTVVLQDGASAVDLDKVGSKFEYAEGIGSGTVSGVAMIPGDWRPGKVPVGGQMQLKCLEPIKLLESATQSICIVPPGIDGLGADEIRIDTVTNGVTRRKINIDTGEITAGDGTEWMPYYGTDSAPIYAQFYDDGDYIYAVSRFTIYRWDKNNGYSMNSVNMPFSSDNYNIYTGKSIYVDSNNHVWGFMATYSQYGSFVAASGRRYDTSEGQASNLSKSDFATWLSTTLGLAVPSAWVSDTDIRCFYPMTLGNYTAFRVESVYGNAIYVVSDPTDIAGSIIDIIPCVQFSDTAWGVGNDYGILSIGADTYISRADSPISRSGVHGIKSAWLTSPDGVLNSGDESSEAIAMLINSRYYCGAGVVSQGSNISIYGRSNYIRQGLNKGVYIARKGMWSCWNSCLKLTQDIDKTAETKITVQYDYTVS